MVRAGYVGIVGLPNAGKSTFLNFLVNQKLSIVTPKPQTTRQRVAGIVTGTDYQIIFWDAPGVVEPATSLNRFLHQEWQQVMKESDVLVAVLNVDAALDRLKEVVEAVNQAQKPWVAVISKVDLKDPSAPPEQIQQMVQTLAGDVTHWLWAWVEPWANASWREDFLSQLARQLPEAPDFYYDPEWVSNQPEEFFISEMIREAAFLCLKEEIPYQLGVKVRQVEHQDSIVRIYADLIVAKESQKPIVVGRSGQMIKKIGTLARQSLEAFFGRKVFLSLYAVVKENWMDNPHWMRDLGYRYVKPLSPKKS